MWIWRQAGRHAAESGCAQANNIDGRSISRNANATVKQGLLCR